MANQVSATVFIKLPKDRQPHKGEVREDLICKCGKPGTAIKMTGGDAKRAFCDDCLWEYRRHYESADRPITIYQNGK